MSAKYFLDTNILVYAHDAEDDSKRQKAEDAIVEGLSTGRGVISAQVLSEFYVTVTRKIKEPMSPSVAKKEVLLLSRLEVVDIEAGMVAKAIDLQQRYKLNYWDALIVVAAERADCAEVYSEDLSDGHRYGSIVIRNILCNGNGKIKS